MPAAREPLDHVVLDTPLHRADEAVRRRRRVRGADLEDLCDQRWVVGDPVPHHDPASRLGHPDHLLSDPERIGSEHRAEDADRHVEARVIEQAEVRGIALLEAQVGQPELLRPRIPGRDQVAGDVDPQYVRAQLSRGHSGGPIAATQVEQLESLGDPKAPNERLAALSHRRGDLCEVALLPECLVRIGRRGHRPLPMSGLVTSGLTRYQEFY